MWEDDQYSTPINCTVTTSVTEDILLSLEKTKTLLNISVCKNNSAQHFAPMSPTFPGTTRLIHIDNSALVISVELICPNSICVTSDSICASMSRVKRTPGVDNQKDVEKPKHKLIYKKRQER